MSNLLETLSPDARAELVAMTPDQVHNLAFDVHVQRMRDRQSEYPTDPAQAIAGASGLLRSAIQIEVDDPVHHVLSTLVTLRLALIGGEGGDDNLDQIDFRALVYFFDDAIRILHDHDRRIAEMADRMRQVSHPIKE
ncbi:hypothetical protein ROE7235_00850 [Roseibaca ekhonensis]|jgi:hypothetical protein|uniref:Uncharacterized protein n=1 Tax=Roseinatronobacter ekhonensis TaxID=254356 RepID=A0A3B0M4S2_9RHOB|nr:hypothetical protein [Roseibaca ekhonensis]SUZ31115.1 hypothetical protein ROE7235_00850 [Roseibaca ekhonensis]